MFLPINRRAAINEFCRRCPTNTANGKTWREISENCKQTSCALYQFRPVTIKSERG